MAFIVRPKLKPQSRWFPAFAFFWPCLFYFRFFVPMDGVVWRLGNDFQGLYYDYKKYLILALADGHFPLWSPTEAGGFPFFSSPFPAAFYPLNLLLLAVYPIFGNYPEFIHQWFTVFGVCLFNLGLFQWLKSMGFSIQSCLASAVILSVSLKIGDTLRFPNAIHTAAWIPWLLYGINRVFLGIQPRRTYFLFLFCSFCFLTAGYPYFIYYSLFLFGPYLLCLLTQEGQKLILKNNSVEVRPALFSIGAMAILVGVIVSPYFWKMASMLSRTTDRTGKSFVYSTEHDFFWRDTLGSLIFPPLASTEGIFYFGVLGVLLLAFEFIRYPRKLPLLLVAYCAFVTLITYGRHSPLFLLLWNYLPGFSSLRVWGRMNILLVPILAWLVADGLDAFSSFLTSEKDRPKLKGITARWCIIALVISATQIVLYRSQAFHSYWTTYIRPAIPSALRDVHSLYFGWIGFLFLLICIASSAKKGLSKKNASLVLMALVAIEILDLSIVGRFMWAEPRNFTLNRAGLSTLTQGRVTSPNPTPNPKPSETVSQPLPFNPVTLQLTEPISSFESRMAQSFLTPRRRGDTILSHTSEFNVGRIENWYYVGFINFLNTSHNDLSAQNEFLGVDRPQKLFCSDSLDHSTVRSFLSDAGRCRIPFIVKYYDGDVLVMDGTFPSAKYLSFIDNWDPDWRASIDGNEVLIERLFATFKAVRVEAGAHQIKFSYNPIPR